MRPYLEKYPTKTKGSEGTQVMIECLPSKCETLSSNPSIAKNKVSKCTVKRLGLTHRHRTAWEIQLPLHTGIAPHITLSHSVLWGPSIYYEYGKTVPPMHTSDAVGQDGSCPWKRNERDRKVLVIL
jgi:hypothetical protein